ncbi:MAG: 4-(cytidine 5'-diphospho)-2-C-methyl-D-erythritol kinase [Chloroflexi bacterium]|nr:4-(cytidine 5'-diphospho)-2-C-methyl-D-erythritol kinase [Chloroflexota bacterium]|tara:strand:+ start:69 stop:935 length:867 start_codon:yes stop_codon:yes gene_type:complete
MNKITEIAPAKINFTLEIKNKRHDGYHNIYSVMQSVNLYDYITIKPSRKFEIISNNDDIPPIGENIITKAYLELKSITGITDNVSIEIKKNIPIGSGLGGGSSDAAATLRALNKLWELKLNLSELISIGINIGSDVPFLICGGCAIVTGKGDIIEQLPRPEIGNMIIFTPVNSYINKTKTMFNFVNKNHFSGGQKTKALGNSIKRKKFQYELVSNVFSEIYTSNFDSKKNLVSHINKLGFYKTFMSGSGPSLYVFTENESESYFIQVSKNNTKNINVNFVKPIDKFEL